jgi:hypothetical protein
MMAGRFAIVPATAGRGTKGNRKFPDMPALAAEMKSLGVRPGIWMRPLLTSENVPESWRFPRGRPCEDSGDNPLDPSVPEVLEQVRTDIARLAGWGYDLIKHDFSTFDIFGQWGVNMRTQMTNNGWHFADRSKTSAEIVLEEKPCIRLYPFVARVDRTRVPRPFVVKPGPRPRSTLHQSGCNTRIKTIKQQKTKTTRNRLRKTPTKPIASSAGQTIWPYQGLC